MSDFGGIQTQDFLNRIRKYEESLPELLQQMAKLMQKMIEEIDRPQLEDVLSLQMELRRQIGDPDNLRAVCGTEGRLCPQCPFGAYLPSGFPYASEARALCLPWIVVVHPETARLRERGESPEAQG